MGIAGAGSCFIALAFIVLAFIALAFIALAVCILAKLLIALAAGCRTVSVIAVTSTAPSTTTAASALAVSSAIPASGFLQLAFPRMGFAGLTIARMGFPAIASGTRFISYGVVRLFYFLEKVGDVEECVALQTDLHEGRLHAGQHAGDFAFVYRAGKGVFVLALEVDLYQLVVFNDRHFAFMWRGSHKQFL